jgi:phosphomannomutase
MSLWDEQIEDRGSQVTFSALGQDAPVAHKRTWDPDGTKKRKLRDYVANAIPEFDVRVGSCTSLDVTKPGMESIRHQKTHRVTRCDKKEGSFVGDRLSKGGNDYPVKAMGVDCLAVTRCQDTALVIQTMLGVT